MSQKSFDDLVGEALNLPFSGWDFSFISDRWKTNPPPWNYLQHARNHMHGISSMLDQETGGGEVLASLTPFPPHIWATENYPPIFQSRNHAWSLWV